VNFCMRLTSKGSSTQFWPTRPKLGTLLICIPLIVALLQGCVAGDPTSENFKDFPAPQFDNKVGSDILVTSVANYVVTGTCSSLVQSIEVSMDQKNWLTLPNSKVSCVTNGTFKVQYTDLPGATLIYARSKGKGKLVSQVVNGNLKVAANGTLSSKYNLGAATGIAKFGSSYKLKFTVGFNQVGATVSGSNFKVRPTSAGAARAQ